MTKLRRATTAATPRISQPHGLYDPADEHDACGVGLVAALDGKPRREVVAAGIDGAEGGLASRRGRCRRQDRRRRRHPCRRSRRISSTTISGAPARRRGPGKLAVGMVFLPRTDLGAQERCRTIVETEILRFGYTIYGWRQVPVEHRR